MCPERGAQASLSVPCGRLGASGRDANDAGMTAPEARALTAVDKPLAAAGWHVCEFEVADPNAAPGRFPREFELKSGHGIAN